ncbi:hypothetical protein SDC9_75683 [bioreactor metagenome]|uniref:Arc-like DNA binding domain-containing protein n=1 Tax=bioreactor metagenome TaxID=1076179 RepID=A0A644YRP3_9ZZZZ
MFKIQKGYDSESKTFRLPIEMIEELEKLAERSKLSLNQLVIQSLKYALDNLEEGDAALENNEEEQHDDEAGRS